MRFLGVDVGGSTLRAAVADERGVLLAEHSEPLVASTPVELMERLRVLTSALGEGEPDATAVGLPAPVSKRGTLGHVVNAPLLSSAPFASLLQEGFAGQVVVENDVNLAALGEHRHGAWQTDDLAFIAVGTGVGMGIIADGRLLRGAHGGAGELGLMPLSVDQMPVRVDELGPLEAVAGGAGIAARWAGQHGSAGGAVDAFLAADAGDPTALAALAAQADALAMAVCTVQTLLDPEIIVFGGGIGSREDVLTRVRAGLERRSVRVPKLRTSALGERAGLVGAVEVARELGVGALPMTIDRGS